MSLASVALISSMLFGFEILWLKFFGSHMAPGPIAFLLPLIFFGGAIGAALIARFPSLADRALSFAAAGLLAGFYSLVQPGLNIAAVVFAVLACAFWGIAQTAFIARSVTPTRTLAAAVTGLIPLLLFPGLLNHFSLLQIAVPFVIFSFLLLIILSRNFVWLALAALPLAWWPAPQPGFYPNTLATLQVRVTGEAPMGLQSRKIASEWSAENSPFRTWQIFRNGIHASDIVDGQTLDELEMLKSDEIYPFIESAAHVTERGGGNAALIGTGGGREILYARLAGFDKITAIEINPAMVAAARDHMSNPELAYGAPGVTTVISEARDFFRKSSEKFDLIVLSDVRNYGATLSLQFAENYLLTDEALTDYVSHLTPEGLLIYRMNGRDADLVDTHHASALATLRKLASEGDEVGLLRRRKGSASVNSFVIAFKKNGFSAEQEASIQSQLAKRPMTARFVESNKLHPRTQAQRLTDDRPYPVWQNASVHQLWIIVLLLFVLTRVGLSNLKESHSEVMLGGFISGLAFIGIQIFTVEQAVFQSGDPLYAPTFALAFGLLASSLGYWQSSPKTNTIWESPIFIAVIWILAVVALKMVHLLPFTPVIRATIAGLISATPLYFTARLYSRLLHGAHSSGRTAAFLAINGCGLLLGGIGSKVITINFGALALAFLCLIALLRISAIADVLFKNTEA